MQIVTQTVPFRVIDGVYDSGPWCDNADCDSLLRASFCFLCECSLCVHCWGEHYACIHYPGLESLYRRDELGRGWHCA